MEVRPDLGPYLSAWRQRFAHADERRAARARSALAVLPALVGHLVSHYGVRRVWLFGSLEEGGFHEHSDIDLAVAGLPPGSALFRAAAELDELAQPFVVDLVPIEEARAALRERVVRRGRVLYDGATPT